MLTLWVSSLLSKSVRKYKMKRYNIVLYIPGRERRDTPYSGEKSAPRHTQLISHFPKSVTFYLATFEDQYISGESFHPAYIRVWETWELYNWEAIEADLTLWLSGRINTKKIYHNPIKEFCRDKTRIESIFPEYTLHSQICDSYEDVVSKFDNISSDVKVFKPCFWSQAEGIIMTSALPKKHELQWEYPYLIQEFINTSDGFEWYPGIHDFRVIILNGKITGSFLRVAPKWVMTANVATWAEIIDFHGKVPEKIQKVIDTVESYTSKLYPDRYYSIDTCIGRNGEVKIFELNSNPMLSTPSIIKGLAQHIIKNILKIW